MIRKINIITLILLILISNTAIANSGPTYWKGYPTFEVLSIEKNSPITIENEDLVFDFSKKEYLEHGNHSISGLVTATYRMSNQSKENQTVQMAFPFVSSLRFFNPYDVAIKVDNQNIPFDIYIGDNPVEYNLNFDAITKSISRDILNPKNYDLNEAGTLYTYDVRTVGIENLRFVIDFFYDDEKTKIVGKGFNSYGWEDGQARVSAWIRDEETVEVFAIGEDIDLNISAFTDGEHKKPTDKYSYELKKEKLSIEEYLNRSIDNHEYSAGYNEFLSKNQLFNFISKRLDELIEKNVFFLMIEDLFALDYEDMIFVILYEVNFPKESEREVSVSYIARGTMDRTSTVDPLYTFEYLLKPAVNWASFKNLNIEIRPPSEYPYIVDKSIQLLRDDDGNYVGAFESLPDKDLSFTLYSKEEVTFIDKVKNKANNLTYALPIINIIGIPLIFVIIVLIKLRKRILEDK